MAKAQTHSENTPIAFHIELTEGQLLGFGYSIIGLLFVLFVAVAKNWFEQNKVRLQVEAAKATAKGTRELATQLAIQTEKNDKFLEDNYNQIKVALKGITATLAGFDRRFETVTKELDKLDQRAQQYAVVLAGQQIEIVNIKSALGMIDRDLIALKGNANSQDKTDREVLRISEELKRLTNQMIELHRKQN